ncbi:hypothetical protein BC833DRAFT_198737 [Globomyces pollinis-pini]|nr:hypothetical protein BC833DRAFT_198737 [Globomyces pollinis-pini]
MDYVENLRPLKPKSAKGNRPQNQYVSLPSLKKQQGVDIGFMGISVSQAPTQYVEREKNVPRPIIEKPTLTYYQQKTVENSDTSVPSLPTLQEKFPSTKSNPYTTKSHKDISKSVSFGQPTEKELIYQQAKPKVKELTQRTRRPLNEEFRRHDSEDEEKLSRSSKKKSKSGIIQPSTVEVFEKLQGRMAKNNSLGTFMTIFIF